MFYGKKMWTIIVMLIGAIAGFYVGYVYLAPYLGPYLAAHNAPTYLSYVVLAVVFAIVVRWLVHIGIAAGIGYAAYYIAGKQTFYDLSARSYTFSGFTVHYYLILVAVIAFFVAYVLYYRISILISAVLGLALMFVGIGYFIPSVYASVIACVFFVLGMWYQAIYKKRGFNDNDVKNQAVRKYQKRLESLRKQALEQDARIAKGLNKF